VEVTVNARAVLRVIISVAVVPRRHLAMVSMQPEVFHICIWDLSVAVQCRTLLAQVHRKFRSPCICVCILKFSSFRSLIRQRGGVE
jgi:hypothetical protein